jgi:hypothetical protein
MALLATMSGFVAKYVFRTNRSTIVIGPVTAISAVLI